jgi:predicted DNA-binding transcriptional regulator AlpA
VIRVPPYADDPSMTFESWTPSYITPRNSSATNRAMAMVAQDISPFRAAQLCGISPSTIYRALARQRDAMAAAGVFYGPAPELPQRPRGRPLSEATKAALKMVREGVAPFGAAKLCGISPNNLYRVLATQARMNAAATRTTTQPRTQAAPAYPKRPRRAV